MPNPIYGNPKPGFVTKCVYAYYVRETGVPKDRVQAFFTERPNNIQNIRTAALSILNEIKAGTLKPCGWGLGDIKWRRRSFILVFFEDQHHRLEQGNAVEFLPYHAFRGGDDITFAAHPDVTGFYCENHLVVAGGGDVDYRGESFRMDINHGGHPIVGALGHNDSGTNLGPPIPPP